MPDDDRTRWPLVSAQEGIWIGQQFDRDSAAFNTAEYVEILGEVDAGLFETAVRRVVGETEALNVRFDAGEDGRAWQEHVGAPQWTFHVLDLTGEAEPVAAALEWMRADIAVPVDLRRDALFGQALFRTGPAHYLWYQRVHHIALDGYGLSLVARRVAQVYTALVEGTDPGPADFGSLLAVVDEDQAYQASERVTADRDYWLERSAGQPEPVVLAHRTGPLSRYVERATADLDESTMDTLRAAADAAGAMWSDVITAAFAAYLHRMTGAPEVVLALPVMSRLGSVSLRVPCMVTNVVPVRVPVERSTSLVELTGQLAAELRASRPHFRYRYEQLRRDLKLVASDRKLFGPSVNIMPFDYGLRFAGHRGVVHNVSAGLVEDLVVHVYHRGDGNGPRVVLDANPNCYERAELDLHLRRFLAFLDRAAGAPDVPLGEVDLLIGDERRRLLVEWNDTARELPDLTVPDLFEAQVAATPDEVALVAENGTFTFAELNRSANRLARTLVARGAGPETYVALLLPRTAESIVALLAVLKAGAGYVPIDPDYPAKRIELMLTDSAPVLLVTTAALGRDVPDLVPVLHLDGPPAEESTSDLRDADRRAPLGPRNPLCLIYTSGSTGLPKGVVIEHRGMVNLFCHHRDTMFVPETAAAGRDRLRVALSASLSFDTSWEGLLWLLAGHELHFIGDDLRREPELMLDYVVERRVDFLDITPTYAEELVAAGLLDEGRHRPRVLALGGEAAGAPLWTALRAVPAISTYNLYGPTECTVDTLHCRLADSPDPIVGRPLANTRAYLLDDGRRLVPPGVAGELYLAGVPLARGYHNRAELTAERFVEDPFGGPGERMYRTGDLARWRADGTLEFLGRADDQVKIRGFRIELGEIEAVLAGHPGVAQAAVLAREDQPGSHRLVGYVVPAGPHAPEAAELRQYVAERLPDYMVPPAFVTLDRFPQNTNGKLDRSALPVPDRGASVAGRAPRDYRETVLCALFAELLAVDEVSIDDDFFSLGGHSLLVARLLGRVRAEFGVTIGIRTVFEAPTVAKLVERLGADADHGALDVVLPLRGGGAEPPLFCFAPVTGLGWSYAGLAASLGTDRPIYAMQAHGIARAEPLPESVAEAAADYVRRIREVQPDGPYHLLGWSYGGLVAHEVAVALQAASAEVALLAMLDAFPLPPEWRARRIGLTERDFFAEILRQADLDEALVAADGDGYAAVAARLREHGSVLGDLDERRLQAMYRVFRNSSRLSASDTPGVFAGEVSLFVATQGKTPDWPGPDTWRPHVDGPLRVYEVDSTHAGMTTPNALAQIGSILAERLAPRRAA